MRRFVKPGGFALFRQTWYYIRYMDQAKEGSVRMNIYESAEDYLEAILMLQEEKGYVRSVDIAARLAVTKP